MAQVTPGMKFQATRSDVKREASLGTARQNTRTKYWAIEDIQDLSNVAATVSSLMCTNKLVFGTEEITGSTGTVSVDKAISYFTIAANATESSTLAAGVDGQVKILVVKSCGASGEHTINLSGSGVATIKFNGDSDGCIIAYVDDRWKLVAGRSNLNWTT